MFLGNKQGCDFFFCQAQFDAENFVNEEIQLCKDINKRFVSMRDYDMQVVDVSSVFVYRKSFLLPFLGCVLPVKL